MPPSAKTPLEQAVDAAVERATTDLRRQIRELQGVDVRVEQRLAGHSGAHRDLATNVRASLSEVREATNTDLLSASNHLASTIEDLSASTNAKLAHLNAKVELLEKMPAQVTALAHVPALASASTSAAIDAKTAAGSAKLDGRWRTVATVFSMVIIAVLQHFLGTK